MQSILAGRYPILLIDESQDTNKHLIDALFAVQATLKGKFLLGLLGDMMQRIYSDGKEGLGEGLPEDWATPGKKLNYRCPKRIITLINKVRSTTDKQHQEPRAAAIEGVVRLFVLPSDLDGKPAAERAIAAYMSKVTGDEEWNEPKAIKPSRRNATGVAILLRSSSFAHECKAPRRSIRCRTHCQDLLTASHSSCLA
jgi:DNA helicase-2/ATP-dependent DNA helicase PcrA